MQSQWKIESLKFVFSHKLWNAWAADQHYPASIKTLPVQINLHFQKWLVSGSDIITQTPPPHCHNYKMLPFHLAVLYHLCLLFLCPLFTVGAIRPTGLCPGQLVQNLCSSSTSVWGSVRPWERNGLAVMCPVRAGPESTLINTQLCSTYVWEGKWPVSNNTITWGTVETDAEGSICPAFNCTACSQILYTIGALCWKDITV